MRNNLIGRVAIEAKSKELDFPMEQLLAAYVLEQLALMLAESDRGKQLLLKNPNVFGIRTSTQKKIPRLYYSYVKKPNEIFDKSSFALFLKNTIKWEKRTNILWSWRSHVEGVKLFVEIIAELDEMKVPVELIIEPIDTDQKMKITHEPKEMTLRLVMEASKTAILYLYPAEELLMDTFGEIFGKLSLIGDISVYQRVYDILEAISFEGREYQMLLEGYFKQQGRKLDEVMYEQLEKMASDSYMQKKWKAYLKKNRKTEPSWEIVYSRFWSFIKPLWSASMNEMVYLGIWIPDLGRYLD